MTPRTDKPWWVDAVVKLGVPAAIALFLVWWLTSSVAASLSTIKDRLDRHVSSSDFYQHQICRNTARTEAERQACDWTPPAGH